MRVLIVGGESVIGSAARKHLENSGARVVATSRRESAEYCVDLAEPANSWQLPDVCSVAILCASRSRLQECEAHRAETRWVNVTQTLELARQLRRRGAFVIFLSTNLVFRGGEGPFSESAAVDPVCEYARQKAEVEHELLAHGGAGVVRLNKVLHPNLPILRDWASAFRRDEEVRAFANLSFSPITPAYVAEALWEIAQRRLAGVIHLSGDTQISYADLARTLARRLRANESLVIPTDAPDGPARSASLDAGRAMRELGLAPLDVAQTVGELIDSLA